MAEQEASETRKDSSQDVIFPSELKVKYSLA